jgi:hypothetical protein
MTDTTENAAYRQLGNLDGTMLVKPTDRREFEVWYQLGRREGAMKAALQDLVWAEQNAGSMSLAVARAIRALRLGLAEE